MANSNSKRSFIASIAILSIGTFSLAAAPAFAFNSGDVPAPVDQSDDAGPGNSHQSASGISGSDGNQGNDRGVGNAGGGRGNGGGGDGTEQGSTDDSHNDDRNNPDAGEGLLQ